MAALSAFESLLSLSFKKEAADLLLNGIYSQEESLITDVWHARGPGSFDIHEDVIVAPSHFLWYCLTSSVLRQIFNKLKERPKECSCASFGLCQWLATGGPYRKLLSLKSWGVWLSPCSTTLFC